MNVSRRTFVHAGCTIAIATLLARPLDKARGMVRGGLVTGSLQGKAQVNLQIPQAGLVEFPFINVATMSAGFFPTGGTPTADPYLSLNSDGYPTAIVPGTTTWRADAQDAYYIDAESFFTGTLSGNQITVTSAVTGKALFVGQTVSDAQNGNGTKIPAGTRITAVNGSTITVSNTLTAGSGVTLYAFIPWVITWGGTVGMNVGPNSNAGVQTNLGVNIGSNRTEYNLAAQSLSGATFTLSLSAGSHSATLTSIVGTLFQGMYITGAGIPEYTVLGSGSGGSWGIGFNADNNLGLSYALSNVSCTGVRIAQGSPVNFTIQVTSFSTALSSLKIFRQDQETLLNGGQITAPHLITALKQYGRLRFMNYNKTNGQMLANWADRPLMSNFSWYSQVGVFLSSKYAGLCGASTKCAYVGLNALPGNPSSWTDKTTVQFTVSDCPAMCNFIGSISGNTLTVSSVISGALRIGLQLRSIASGTVSACNITAGSGTSWTVDGSAQTVTSQQIIAVAIITGMSNANPCVITCNNHGLSNGDVICIPPGEIVGGNFDSLIGRGSVNNIGGPTGTLFTNDYAVTVITANTFSIAVDSTSMGTYSSGGAFFYAPTFKTGLLPAKQITGIGLGQFGVSQFAGFKWNGGNLYPSLLITAVYDATLDILICAGGGNGVENEFGVPYEACVQMAKEINGPDAWISVPAFFTDSAANSLAAYIKANLTDVTPLKWIGELSNEVWNTAQGFWQTYYAQAIAFTKWGTSTTSPISQWFGWRWNAVLAQINSVYGSNRFDGRCVRMFSFNGTASESPTYRTTAPASGISGNNLDSATELCWADYIALGTQGGGGSFQSLPDAQTIYNYQQGIVTNNNTLIQSALNNMDAMYNATGCGVFFCPVSGFIDDGSGNGSPSGIAGTVFTVTAISAGSGFLIPTNQKIGQWSVVGGFGGSNPALGSVVDHQLSGTTGGVGRYQLKASAPNQNITATQFTVRGSNIWHNLNDYLPNWVSLATAHSITCSFYEGGTGDFPSFTSQFSSYSGNPLNVQDVFNLYQGYYRSSQMQTTMAGFLASIKSGGGVHSSQYCYANFAPQYGGGMYGMIMPGIFGTPFPFKTAFDSYNSS